ncbi:hypothetical protein BSKO_01276 [Bryopsis sp. KO-2023]|nr:hypothetical protein BSKO_01276 [Bryopsis sp. KO-2023]
MGTYFCPIGDSSSCHAGVCFLTTCFLLLFVAENCDANPIITVTFHDECAAPEASTAVSCGRKGLGDCVQAGGVCDEFVTQWTDKEKRSVGWGLHHLSSSIGDPNVHTCITTYARRFDGVTRDQAFLDFEALAHAMHWPILHLHARSDPKGLWRGRASPDRKAWGTHNSLRWSAELSMEINLANLQKSEHTDASIGRALAGTILHETLHQMGHRDPASKFQEPPASEMGVDVYQDMSAGSSGMDEYLEGYFSVVAGDCLESGGKGVRPGTAPPNGFHMSSTGGYDFAVAND